MFIYMATHFSLLFKGSGLLAGTGVYFTYHENALHNV